MALKKFKDLYNLDLKDYIQKKPTFKRVEGKLVKTNKNIWLDYIEWSMVLFLLYENGAEKVIPEFEVDNNGYPAFFDSNKKNPFVKIKLTIDDKVYYYHYPVINGNKVSDNPNQMEIHNAQQRCLVKCVAVNTGLGLKLWQKDEKNFDDIPQLQSQNNKPELLPGTDAWKKAIQGLKNGYKITDVRKKYFMTEENEGRLIDESL